MKNIPTEIKSNPFLILFCTLNRKSKILLELVLMEKDFLNRINNWLIFPTLNPSVRINSDNILRKCEILSCTDDQISENKGLRLIKGNRGNLKNRLFWLKETNSPSSGEFAVRQILDAPK